MTIQQTSSSNIQRSLLNIVHKASSQRSTDSVGGSFTEQAELQGAFGVSEQASASAAVNQTSAPTSATGSSQSTAFLTPFSAPALAAMAAGAVKTTPACKVGRLTTSGAPEILLSENPQASSLGYTGPASFNPYFTSPENPLRAGFVTGFDQWFTQPTVHSAIDSSASYAMNPLHNATAEGAAEALRLIRGLDPGAQATEYRFGEEGGPYAADGVTREITLSDGTRLNAGNILNYYYNGSAGVTAGSDQALERLVTRAG